MAISERSIPYSEPQIDNETPVAHPQTLELMKKSIQTGTWQLIDPARRNLLSIYYFQPGIKLSDLKDYDPDRKTGNLRHVVLSSLHEAWENLPIAARETIDPQKAVKLKHPSYSSQHRRRMGETLGGKNLPLAQRKKMSETRRGKKHTAETKNKMKMSQKRVWADPEYRERMITVFQDRHPDTQIWETAKAEGLIEKIVDKGLMSTEEIYRLRRYFASKRKKGPIIELLLEKFSLAVANSA